MLSKKENETLDEYVDVMASNLMQTSEVPFSTIWPAPRTTILEARWYSHGFFPKTFLKMCQKLEENGYSEEEIAELFEYPSTLSLFLFWVDGKETLQMPKDDIIEYTLKIINYISFLRREDIWCRDGRNLVLSEENFEELVENSNWFDLEGKKAEEIKNSASRINTTLWLYTELLYYACHAWGHESHGPYDIDENRQLVIREYHDLKTPFWDFSKEIKSEKITTLEIYSKDADVSFDLFSRTRSKGNFLEYLLKYGIKIGGVEGQSLETIDELEDLKNNLIKTANKGSEFESKLEKKEIIKKYNLATYFVGIRPLANALNEDWMPPQKMLKMIEEEKAQQSEFLTQKLEGLKKAPELPEKKLYQILSESFDPRMM